MMEGSGERGAALVVVLMVASLVTAATLGVVMATRTEVGVAAAFCSGLQVHHLAEAGIHRALADLRAAPDWTAALDGTATASFVEGPPHGIRSVPGGPTVDLDRVQSLATCGKLSGCSEEDRTRVVSERPWGANNPRWRPYAYGPSSSLADVWAEATMPSYVVVLVADDPAESDSNPDRDGGSGVPGIPGSSGGAGSPGNYGAGSGVIRLRAEAFGPGGAHRAVEAVVARSPQGSRVRVVQWRRAG